MQLRFVAFSWVWASLLASWSTGLYSEMRQPFDATSLTDFKNCSAATVRRSLSHTTPITNGSGVGDRGMSFKRGPTVQASDFGATATPEPASIAATRLVPLSYSPTIRGLPGRPAKRESRYS